MKQPNTSKQTKDISWQTEFDKLFLIDHIPTITCWDLHSIGIDDIKAFISKTIQSEVAKEREKVIKEWFKKSKLKNRLTVKVLKTQIDKLEKNIQCGKCGIEIKYPYCVDCAWTLPVQD